MDQIDPMSVLMAKPPGSAIWMITPDGAVVAGREDRQALRTYPMPCPVAHRLHAWEINGVVVIAWLARLDDRDNSTWETWINAHDTDGLGQRGLTLLSTQSHLDVHLYVNNPDKPARSLRSPNLLKPTAAELLARAADREPWSMGAFDRARGQIYQRHPSIAALWATGS